MLLRCTPLKPGEALFRICASVALAISACYELIEWQAAIWTAPEQAEAFLGTPGVIGDTQKDMTMALIGSIVSQLTLSRVHDRRLAELPRPAATS
jgi:putative membrane protein